MILYYVDGMNVMDSNYQMKRSVFPPLIDAMSDIHIILEARRLVKID
jgi:hypothetical protein